MRTETVTYKIYKYSELSDDAKAKAFEWFKSVRADENYIFTEDCEDSLKLRFPNSELQVQYSLSYSQGDGLNIFGNLYLPDVLPYIKDKFTEEEFSYIKHIVNEYGTGEGCWFGDQYVKMQRNTRYAYCIAACNEYVAAMRDNIVCEIEIAEESERKPDAIINDELINRLNMYVVEYFFNLCKEYEEWGYEFFYPEDDTEFIELCEANDWEFYENGAFYC